MVYRLISDRLQVAVHSKGAELCGVQDESGYEFIWQADPSVWARHAPVLFPIVGKLKDGTYHHLGKTYSLPQHGFARDLEFEALVYNDSDLRLGLRSNASTRENYPFEFNLQMTYSLIGNRLVSKYRVENTGATNLYFSLGAHPGFNLPQNDGHEKNTLQFKEKVIKVSTLQEGLLSGKDYPLSLSGGKLELKPDVFENDALVLENAQIAEVRLDLVSIAKGIVLRCPDWPYFGIWSKYTDPGEDLKFICLEPWYGVADVAGQKGEFSGKRGIQNLQAGAVFEAAYELEFVNLSG